MTPVSRPSNSPALPEKGRVEVLINQALPKTLTYCLGEGQQAVAGSLVAVPLGKKKGFGVVMGPSTEKIDEARLKNVEAVLELPPLQKTLIDFVQWVADYTLSPPGSVLAMVLGGQSVLAAKKPRK